MPRIDEWYHDRKVGVVAQHGQPGIVCRGFTTEHGDVLAASQDLRDVLLVAQAMLEDLRDGADQDNGRIHAVLYNIDRALRKARGEVSALPVHGSYPGHARGNNATGDRCTTCGRLIGHGAYVVRVGHNWWHRDCYGDAEGRATDGS